MRGSDADADESNVCDCDDNDATAYPGAPPTAEVDNNCDSLGEDRSLACDWMPFRPECDLTVSIADLLLLLSEFGCTEGCTADINGDGQVAVSDVLELLSNFSGVNGRWIHPPSPSKLQ